MAETFKYRAFLSYSHTDTGVAKRVHGRLEGFHIDKDLVGRDTPAGSIPATLRRIFRDRQDFDAGASLADETILALDGSAALIVLASPQAARSKFVNEELRQFKLRHPDRPVIPLIVDAETGDVEEECFPPALRFIVAKDGSITDKPVDVLAADLREKGDGFELALAKVVARMLGLAPDDVYRRAERERRKQARLRTAIAAVIVVLAIAGGGFYWQSRQQQQTLAEISALVDKYSFVSPAKADTPGASASLTEAITTIAQGAATDPRYAKALELLKAGKPTEAEPLLKAVAEDKAKRADKDAKDAAAAYRNLASITAVSDPGRARGYYAEAARLDPTNIDGMLQNGWFQKDAGQLDAAQAAFSHVIADAKPGINDRSLVWAKFGIGDIQRQRGNLGAGLTTYREAETVANRLAKSDPGNAEWQRDLSASYERVGDVQVDQGNLPAALASYQAGLTIKERLAKSDPGNAGRQRDLSIPYAKIGIVQYLQGNLPAAFASYQTSLTIRERLAKTDPGNAEWQHDLAVSYDVVGDVQMAQGILPAAFASYQAGLTIKERLAKSDPGNAGWQRDLSVSYEKMGDVQLKQRDLGAAIASYQASFDLIDRLVKSDPGNVGWQHDLSIEYNNVGDVQKAQGNLPAALASYQASLTIKERLAKSDPGNAGWQRNLSVSYERIGNVQVAQGNLSAALASHQASLTIRERLAKSDPGNGVWQRDLAAAYSMLANVYLKTEQSGKAREALVAGRDIMARLVAQFSEHAQWKHDLAWFDQKIAALKD